jgi:hypothetical protein
MAQAAIVMTMKQWRTDLVMMAGLNLGKSSE